MNRCIRRAFLWAVLAVGWFWLLLVSGCKKDGSGYVSGEAPIEKVGPLSGRCQTLGVERWYWNGPDGGVRMCEWEGFVWHCSGPGVYNPMCEKRSRLHPEETVRPCTLKENCP